MSRNEDRLKTVLEGRTIRALYIADGEHVLGIQTGKYMMEAFNSYLLTVEGDCCSESWFADIDGVDALIGRVVQDVEVVSIGRVEDGRTRQEEDVAYSIKVKTDKGRANIVFRNSSNGYYGGWFDGITETHPDVFAGMTEITDDWSA